MSFFTFNNLDQLCYSLPNSPLLTPTFGYYPPPSPLVTPTLLTPQVSDPYQPLHVLTPPSTPTLFDFSTLTMPLNYESLIHRPTPMYASSRASPYPTTKPKPAKCKPTAEPKQETYEPTSDTPKTSKKTTKSGGGKMKSKRTRVPSRDRTDLTDSQKASLEAVFTVYKYVGPDVRAKIAEELGLPDKTVLYWFQNRRVRQKKEEKSKQ